MAKGWSQKKKKKKSEGLQFYSQLQNLKISKRTLINATSLNAFSGLTARFSVVMIGNSGYSGRRRQDLCSSTKLG
jgi:hypothetical protein